MPEANSADWGLVPLPGVMTWGEGKEACAEMGMTIADSYSTNRANQIRTVTGSTEPFWLGRSAQVDTGSGVREWLTEAGHHPARGPGPTGLITSVVPLCAAASSTGALETVACSQRRRVACSGDEVIGTVPNDVIQGRCPLGWITDVGEARCVRYVRARATFSQALSTCLGYGGQLLSVGQDTNSNLIWRDAARPFVASEAVWMSAARSGNAYVDVRNLSPLGDTFGLPATASQPYAAIWRDNMNTIWVAVEKSVTDTATVVCETSFDLLPDFATRGPRVCAQGWLLFMGACVRSSTWTDGASGFGDVTATWEEADRQCMAMGGEGLLHASHQFWYDNLPAFINGGASVSSTVYTGAWSGIKRGTLTWEWSATSFEVCDGSSPDCGSSGGGCSPASCAAALAPASTVSDAFEFTLTSTYAYLSKRAKSTQLPFLCAVRPAEACSRGSGYRYFRGKCFGVETSAAATPLVLEQMCSAHGGMAAGVLSQEHGAWLESELSVAAGTDLTYTGPSV